MERLKAWLRQPEYEAIEDSTVEGTDPLLQEAEQKSGFSWMEYSIFLLLGVSMLWAWNMFLAAGPYFQQRFHSDPWITNNFQAAELSVSTVANLGAMLVLTKLQANASYPKRIMASLVINMVTFLLLALSTRFFLTISARIYFGFLIAMVFAASVAAGLCQNGIFAFVSGFGQPRYTQGIMTGQGVAGVLPCIAQILLVLLIPSQKSAPEADDGTPVSPEPPSTPGAAAFGYFLTATGISIITLFAFLYLLRRQAISRAKSATDETAPDTEDSDISDQRKSIPLLRLFQKTFCLAIAVFVTFAVTMFFPIYTQRILSTVPPDRAPRILQPPAFIPLAFLLWNAGDLLGRVLTAAVSMTQRPRLVLLLALLRILFIPLYLLCNIGGQGALVHSDIFYLVVVQMLFGVSNGYLGSTCMIGAGEWVNPDEREAAGGFMSLCLVLGLAVGSFLSFFAAGT